MRLTEPYRPRTVRCLEVAEFDGWRIKVYGIAYEGSTPERTLVGAALDTARPNLPDPAITDDRYGVGFLGVHQGRSSNFVFLDWWAQENELHHRIWFSSQTQPASLRAARPGDPIACAWDLTLLAHERDARVSHVLTKFDSPDLDGYLAAQMNADG
jgi:hypothetical protein